MKFAGVIALFVATATAAPLLGGVTDTVGSLVEDPAMAVAKVEDTTNGLVGGVEKMANNVVGGAENTVNGLVGEVGHTVGGLLKPVTGVVGGAAGGVLKN